MSLHTETFTVVPQGSYSASGISTGFLVGSYEAGTLFIHITTLGGSTPKLMPRWQISPNGNVATGGRYVTIRTYATAIAATGISVMTLPAVAANWARLNYRVSGTAAAVAFRAWVAIRGQY